jgi:hypothetical protein
MDEATEGGPAARGRARADALVATAAPSWAGEAEIARTYLAAHRTPARDVFFLRAQAWKETRLVRVLPASERATALRGERVADHPEGASAEKLAQELVHFRLLAGLIAELTGSHPTLDDLEELPEETRLQALRAPWRAGSPLERAVVNFTEGGGGAIFRTIAALDGGPFERRMAAAFRAIHDDELDHGPAEIRTVAGLARSASDWRHAADMVRRIGRQRLRMRNEMFSRPLAEQRLDEIAAGRIAPWPMPVAW